jgi:hypothetical protein
LFPERWEPSHFKANAGTWLASANQIERVSVKTVDPTMVDEKKSPILPLPDLYS